MLVADVDKPLLQRAAIACGCQSRGTLTQYRAALFVASLHSPLTEALLQGERGSCSCSGSHTGGTGTCSLNGAAACSLIRCCGCSAACPVSAGC